jgi:hypothetical protein
MEAQMELRSPKTISIVLLLFFSVFFAWQFADGGIVYARAIIKAKKDVASPGGYSTHVVAYRARYESEQRTYWLLVSGSIGMEFVKVLIKYGPNGEQPELQVVGYWFNRPLHPTAVGVG